MLKSKSLDYQAKIINIKSNSKSLIQNEDHTFSVMSKDHSVWISE